VGDAGSSEHAGPTPDRFTLDYGDGLVAVEVDDWGSDGDAWSLIDGDKVTVYGLIDDGLFETRSIEASSVYVDALNTYLYASSDDEEGDWIQWVAADPVVVSHTHVRGKVTDIDPLQRELTVQVGDGEMRVDTKTLGYSPLDDKGFQQVDEGDQVSVGGVIDVGFFEGRGLDATSLATLYDASRTP
jgi:hypothetical protein